MRADWSRADPRVARYVQRFGRASIPLDIVYGPARPNSEPLPELLRASPLMDTLRRATGAT